MIPEWIGEMLNVRFSGRRSPRLAAGFAVMSSLWAALTPPGAAQHVDPKLFQELRWRSIGPFRGGRGVAVTGVKGEAGVFYFGRGGGGVWKTKVAVRQWRHRFSCHAI